MSPEKRGRPRAFDPAAALEKALAVFLRQGYDATSLDDLTVAMGINRPSLYAAFGSKGALYDAALRHYAARGIERMMAELTASDDIVTGVQNILRGWAQKMATGCEGCLVVASAAQCGRRAAAEDAPIEAATRRIVADIGTRLHACFAAAQERKRLKAGIDARALAHYVAGLIQGLATFGRTSGDAAAVRDMAEVACAFLETLRA
jgi:AcrR family transcriptional regulator